ncbi:MAG: hypothetical protein QM775_13830 [Pirellulales bacterium]
MAIVFVPLGDFCAARAIELRERYEVWGKESWGTEEDDDYDDDGPDRRY